MDIELPNGTVIQGVPEGTTKQQVMDKAIKAGLAKAEDFGNVSSTLAKPPEEKSALMSWIVNFGKEQQAVREKILPRKTFEESTIGKFVKGVEDPFTGTAQLAAEAVGNKTIPEKIKKKEQQYQAAREASGDTGFEAARLLGNIASPLNYAIPGAGEAGLLRSVTTGAALAATQPVYGEDFWQSKGIQASLGAILGPAMEYGIKGANTLVDKMKGLSSTGQLQALQDWAAKLTGKDKEVLDALSSAKQIVPGSQPTAAEAVANLPQGVQLAAAQQAMSRVPNQGAAFEARAQAQQAARQAELGKIAGTPEQRAAVEAARQATGETREKALAQADVVKNAYDELKANVMGETNRIVTQRGGSYLSGEGIPVTNIEEVGKKRLIALQQQQRVDLANNGFFPVESKNIIGDINKAIDSSSSDLSKSVLSMAKQKILDKTDENGFISSEDLYQNVRKTLNQDIQSLLTQANKPAQGGIPEQAAKAAGNVKTFIDKSLDKSSGNLWSKYINDFQEHSAKLDRMAIGDALSKKLGVPLDNNKERAGAFAQAVAESAGLIKKSTGFPRYDKLESVLTPEEVSSVNKVLADLQRQSKASILAGKIKTPVYETATPLESVGLLNRAYTLAKETLGYLARGKREEFEKKFTELALDPQQLAIFIQAGPITTQRKLVEAINKNLSPEGQRVLMQAVSVQPLGQAAGQ